MSEIKINVNEAFFNEPEETSLKNTEIMDPTNSPSWHIPRPSLVGKPDKNSENEAWNHYEKLPSSFSKTSQGSVASTHSAASGTLLLTAANLKTLAAMHPPSVINKKPLDTVSMASSTHFTVVNGLGKPSTTYTKSWCARNQLTMLVCTMSFLFMLGLLVGILYMDMRISSNGRYK